MRQPKNRRQQFGTFLLNFSIQGFAAVVGENSTGHFIGGGRVAQSFETLDELTLHAHKQFAVLHIVAHTMRALPCHYQLYKIDMRVCAKANGYIQHPFCHLMSPLSRKGPDLQP